MFDMPKHVNPTDTGYRLVIYYDKEKNHFRLAGLHVFKRSNQFRSTKDGDELIFNSLEEVVDHLMNYRESDPNQMPLPMPIEDKDNA